MKKIKGINIILHQKIDTGETDGFNNPIFEIVSTTVENVLVSPSESTDVIDQLNLRGKKAVYTLGIPKGDRHIWEDNDVEFFGEVFHVFTPVIKGIEDLIPLDWNGKVMVERYE